MSKKTATKKTKKPTQKVATLKAKRTGRVWHTVSDDPAADFRRFAALLLIDTKERLTAIEGSVDMLGQRIDAMRHEQVALSQESRSVPAEEWVPVIGEYYTATADLGWYKNGCVYRYGHHAGRITEHLAMCDKPHSSITFSPEHHGHILRPATVQEIADHKAKEEQRAKELAKRTARIAELKKELAELESQA